MAKIRLFIASSLDGYIARNSEEVDWLFTDADYGYTEFSDQIDTVIMGRKTYQQILSFGEYPYPGKEGFVFSNTLSVQTNQSVKFVGGDLREFINGLIARSKRDIWLVGGSQIIDYFLHQGWIDELILSIHPLILGQGIPLIVNNHNLETRLEFKEVRTYNSGLLQVYYDLIKTFQRE